MKLTRFYGNVLSVQGCCVDEETRRPFGDISVLIADAVNGSMVKVEAFLLLDDYATAIDCHKIGHTSSFFGFYNEDAKRIEYIKDFADYGEYLSTSAIFKKTWEQKQ